MMFDANLDWFIPTRAFKSEPVFPEAARLTLAHRIMDIRAIAGVSRIQTARLTRTLSEARAIGKSCAALTC